MSLKYYYQIESYLIKYFLQIEAPYPLTLFFEILFQRWKSLMNQSANE